MESETTRVKNLTNNENSDEDFDDKSSQSSSDEVYISKSVKKLKTSPHSDLESIDWDHFANSGKEYPVSGKQVKDFLTHTYRVKDISKTEDISALNEMISDLILINDQY
ncbi:unnamed protein product [Pieris macdunnoughi]|uniref:Uncharacterized protein n=1 Tax=Pieris macdunnoughi TaxID=345717 RepID=A0A821ULB8_9NEOP|nr:unnamed protein product [Pieris macdunnoughi]